MNVLVDHQIFLLQKFGGISRYHASIDYHINALKSGDTSIIKNLGSSNAYLSTSYGFLKILNSKRTKFILHGINKKTIQFNVSNFDVFHPTYYDPYFLSLKCLPPFVVTIHDMIPETYFGETKSWLVENKKKIISRASAIIAISEATKNEIVQIGDVDPNLIHVIHHGYPRTINEVEKENTIDYVEQTNPYLLFIGLRGHYKNFIFFIKSVYPFMKKNNISLKVIGPVATLDEVQMIRQFGIENLVSFESNVAEKQLHNYYNKALCFVFPSIAEGFGMPILEAFVAGCPVICSDISVFREIAEDAALYFKQEPQSLNNALESIYQSADLRHSLITLGYKRIKKFEWKEKAEQTLLVYKSVLR